ncbi:conserved hypothetical protein [Ricinus communis]|uniref:Uncharacterized protein n=1 Tax=Ricinus communis TaxID=3988 RepID=B9SQE9_RICCO|nr:conserved hypothetical protein [Ricinus communis]
MEVGDFSFEDEQYIEARKNLRWAKVHEVESIDDDNEAISIWKRVLLARKGKKTTEKEKKNETEENKKTEGPCRDRLNIVLEDLP